MRDRAVAVEDHGVGGVVGRQPIEVLLVVGLMLSEEDRRGSGGAISSPLLLWPSTIYGRVPALVRTEGMGVNLND
jgi:hypothetical protein